MVIAAHYAGPYVTHGPLETVIHQGSFAVTIFFVLSGFLITHILLRDEITTGHISLRLFYLRRALRILPPLGFFLLGAAALSKAGFFSIPGPDIFFSALFVRNYFGSSLSETLHLWSLAIEEQFYLLWPLALIATRTMVNRVVLCLVLIGFAPIWRQINYHLAGGAANVSAFRTDIRYDPLIIGCLLAVLWSIPKLSGAFRSKRITNDWIALGAVSVIAFFLLLTGFFKFRIMEASSLSVCSLCVAVIINCAVNNPVSVQGKILNNRVLRWVGRISYSLYLWQQLFIPPTPAVNPPWFKTFPMNLSLVFGLAMLSYYVVERPFVGLRRRLEPATKSIPNVGQFSTQANTQP